MVRNPAEGPPWSCRLPGTLAGQAADPEAGSAFSPPLPAAQRFPDRPDSRPSLAITVTEATQRRGHGARAQKGSWLCVASSNCTATKITSPGHPAGSAATRPRHSVTPVTRPPARIPGCGLPSPGQQVTREGGAGPTARDLEDSQRPQLGQWPRSEVTKLWKVFVTRPQLTD